MKYKALLLLAPAFLVALTSLAAPPKVTDVIASQREGTKLVDISYELELPDGSSAFVEIWFSHNNGLTFPISASAVSGHVNAGVTAGTNKAVVWDAEVDWDQGLTQQGKIRVIATYGDEPSGFTGSGEDDSGGSGQADASLVTVPWDVYWRYESWNTQNPWTDTSSGMASWFSQKGANLALMKVDPTEVTNEKWNEVAEWALANGYTQLPLASNNADPDLPMTGINLWQALKWCNARSEKDGLDPAYYMDVSETLGDWNNDGQITNGPDSFQAWGPQDANSNGVWDQGEDFTDANSNQVFDGVEYMDLNNNGQHDAGRTQVFRAGSNIPNYGKYANVGSTHLSYSENCIDWGANGYRLAQYDIFFKLATGGNHQKKWPWGDQAPNEYPEFASSVHASNPPYSNVHETVQADSLPANGYGLKNLIGNVAEWGESAHESAGVIKGDVFGGSYLGLSKADDAQTSAFTGPAAALSLFDLVLSGPADTTSPAVGLRCVRYK